MNHPFYYGFERQLQSWKCEPKMVHTNEPFSAKKVQTEIKIVKFSTEAGWHTNCYI
jgi:hypothetical protein